VWAGLLDRQPAEPVGQCLGRPAETLLGPGSLGEWPGGVDHDCLTGDVDLAGCFPVPPDGGVVQPGVVRGHLRRVMIEDAPHHLLGDVPVDQPGAEGVSPLVWGQRHRSAVGVTDLAAGQPPVEREPVGRGSDRGAAVGVLRRPRKQHRRLPDAGLLLDDQGVELLVDRDQRLAFHLVVVIAQVGGAVGVGDPQTGPNQDQGDQSVVRVGEPREVDGVLDLGHHLLGQRARWALRAAGEVVAEHQRGGRQRVVPLVLADRVQEHVELSDVVTVALAPGQLGVQVSEVAFDHRPIDLGEHGDVDVLAEHREPGQCEQSAAGDR